jgi:hypothetical protein
MELTRSVISEIIGYGIQVIYIISKDMLFLRHSTVRLSITDLMIVVG